MQQNHNRPSVRTIEEVIDETATVRTLVFSDEVMHDALPGQFAMVWVPGVGELPMSVMVSTEPHRAAFTVRRHGTSSTGLFNTGVGQKIGVRGPYGNSFEVRGGKVMLIGGGTGLVPLMRLASHFTPSDDVTVLMGAKTADEVFFEKFADEILSDNPHKIIVATEDGTYGRRGLVTDVMEELCGNTGFEAAYTCGPEMMMYKAVQIAKSGGIPIQASLERVMKCGVGICGSCCAGRDLVCRDGTIFDGDRLASNPDFGRSFRNKAGIAENFPTFSSKV